MDVPSWVVLKISYASLATIPLFINLSMFLSTPLNKAFKALEFLSANLSSSLDHSYSGFNSVVSFPSLFFIKG